MVVMKNRMVGGWAAAVMLAGVLIVPCVAAAGQDFALGKGRKYRPEMADNRILRSSIREKRS